MEGVAIPPVPILAARRLHGQRGRRGAGGGAGGEPALGVPGEDAHDDVEHGARHVDVEGLPAPHLGFDPAPRPRHHAAQRRVGPHGPVARPPLQQRLPLPDAPVQVVARRHDPAREAHAAPVLRVEPGPHATHPEMQKR